jgi:hypothetical protein
MSAQPDLPSSLEREEIRQPPISPVDIARKQLESGLLELVAEPLDVTLCSGEPVSRGPKPTSGAAVAAG